jgi:electron transport complex protein RnfG
MRETIKYGIILSLICAVASGLLAGVNSLTKSRILAQTKQEEEASLREVITEAQHFEPVKTGEDIIYYKAYNKDGKFMGVAFKVSGKGYSSTIETMVGMLKDGTITAIKILNQNETPGLGARVVEPGFIGQFKEKNTQDLIEVQAITGATISSRAVIDSVKSKTDQIKELIKDEQ